MAASVVLALARHRGAIGRVGRAHLDLALVVVSIVGAVQVSVVEVIDVVVVLNLRMPTEVAVLVRVASVHVATHIRSS
jgi:hypothetical protein